MQSAFGKICEILHDPAGNPVAFLLDGRLEVRFWACHANFAAVAATAIPGSYVEVLGDLRTDDGDRKYLLAALITNRSLRRTISLPTPVYQGKPGMSSYAAPNVAASLVRLRTESQSEPEESSSNFMFLGSPPAAEQIPGTETARESTNGHSRQPARTEAALAIERAYDELHRAQAVLAYLAVMKRRIPGITEFFEEAKTTYTEGLLQYSRQQYQGAHECALASTDLSRVVEMVISRTLRSDTTYPSIVSPPPEHADGGIDFGRLQAELNLGREILLRVHFLMQTLPAEALAQVRKITSWGDAFHEQARRLCGDGLPWEATELAQAASTAAHFAEHICRKWYGGQRHYR
jgi:hypothetical protein